MIYVGFYMGVEWVSWSEISSLTILKQYENSDYEIFQDGPSVPSQYKP